MRSALPVLLAAALACGDEDRTQTGYTPSVDKTSTSIDDTAPPLARAVPERPDTVVVPPPGPRTMALTLTPVRGGRSRAHVTLGRLGDHTTVAIALQGGSPMVHHQGQVRRGTCGRVGVGVARLNPLSTDSAGRGASDSGVAVPSGALSAAPHVVVLGLDGRVELCASIRGDSA